MARRPPRAGRHPLGTDGPDGFSSVVGAVATLGGTLVALALTFWAIGHFWGQASSTRRLAAGVSVGTAVFLGGIQLLTLAEQRGLENAAQAGDVGFALGVSLIAAIAIGALVAWLLVPGDVVQAATAPVPATAPRLPLPEGERAVWIRQVTGRSGAWIMVVTTVLTGGMAILTAQWWMLTIPAALTVLGATMLVLTVRVDARGLDAQEDADDDRARAWAVSARTAFLAGYRAGSGASPEGALLDALELDKAVYEAIYEARHRPAWVPIPLAAVARLATR